MARAESALGRVFELARDYIATHRDRPVWPLTSLEALRRALNGPLPAEPASDFDVVEQLARAAEPGLVATAGPRYFGFVTGGALPATVAADWLASAWDQNAGLFVMSPAAAVVEEVAGAWLLELLGLPATASVAFVTGCHMANFTALAAARHELLRRAGWDVEADGLQAAPGLRVIVGDEVHVSVVGALRMLGIGSRQLVRVAADDQGRRVSGTIGGPGARADGLDSRVVSPGPRLCRVCGASIARAPRRRRPRRPLLPPRAAVRGSPERRRSRADSERGRAESGARARRAVGRRSGCRDGLRARCDSGRAHLLARRYHVARDARDANLRLQLVDDRRGRRQVRGIDPRRGPPAILIQRPPPRETGNRVRFCPFSNST